MIIRYLSPDTIFVNPKVKDKEELFHFLAKKAQSHHLISSADEFESALKERQNLGVTELKPHVVMPHARGAFVKELFVMFALFPEGLNYQGAKKSKAEVVIIIGIPQQDKNYLKLLASVSRLISKEGLTEELMKSEVGEDVLFLLKKHSIEAKEEEVKSPHKFLVFLSLNQTASSSQIAPLMTEIGVNSATEIEGTNLGHASFFFPFLTAFGFSGGVSKYNHCYFGLTDERLAAAKLYALLKEEGIDLNDPGVGSLFQIEVEASYGGYADDFDF